MLLIGGIVDILVTAAPPLVALLLSAAVAFTALPAPMSASAHLAVQRNAFSTAAAAAKVCDGAASASIAERIANVQVESSPDGRSLFVLMPSITHSALIGVQPKGAATTGAVTIGLNAADIKCPPTVHGFAGFITRTIVTTAPVAADVVGVASTVKAEDLMEGTLDSTKLLATYVKNKDAPDEYRMVSAGMRLTCINAADSNNGWFEAIRIRPSWSTEGTKAYPNNADPKLATAFALSVDPNRWEEGVLVQSNWSNDPSYVTGRLRDLGRHTFYLQNFKGRRFQRWPAQVNEDAFDDYEEQPCGFDPNFDVVAVRVFSSASDTSTLQQTIHCHVVKNWETMYDANKALARFMTSTISAKKAVEYTDRQMTRDPKASMIRSASSYSYRY